MTWGDAMKDIKEKPTAHMPRSNATGEIPKAALKKAWAEAKEKSRTMLRESTSTQGDGDYKTAQDTSSVVTDTSYSVIKQNTDFTVQQRRKIARKQIEKYRERRSAEQTETTRVHTASERGVSHKQAGRGTLPDAEPRPRRGADLPRQRAKEKVVTAKTAPRDIRGVTQGQRRTRTAKNQTVRSVTTQVQMQTRAQKIRFAAQKVAGGTGRTAVAVRSAIRNFLADLHSLTAVLAAGASFALSIVIIISLVAFVSGSAYGIFFAADAPNAASITVREAVETLTAEYRDKLEEISDTVQHDRQDITANDDVYYIRWQDVLAVFSSYVAGSEQGAPVAGTITSQFGHRVDPITGAVSSHTGTDIACAEGTPILAAADGIVTVANGLDRWGGSYGYYVQIDHGGGLETLYAHCSSICVTTGQQVQAGQVIGYVGHTGRVTGSHLHLEVRIDGNRADAMQYFTL